MVLSSQAAQLGKRLKSLAEYRDPSAIDSSKIEKMGHLLQGMGRDYLKNMPASAVQGAMATLTNVSFPRGEAKELLAKIKGDVSIWVIGHTSGLPERGTLRPS